MKTVGRSIIALLSFVIILCLFSWSNASASTIFFDDFNSENGGVQLNNYDSFANWNVTRGTVDVITYNSVFYFLGSGIYVDMDGSTWSAGRIETKTTFDLLPGDYKLSFIASGNNRGRPTDVMTISVGSVFSETLTIEPTEPLTVYQFNFHVDSATSGKIVFDHEGGNNCGIIIDDVLLTSSNSEVPEPMTIFLFGLGLIGLAAIKRKQIY